MHRKRLLCWKAYLPRSSWPIRPTTPIICAKPSLPKARSPSSPTTRHGRSNIRSTSISMPSVISWSAASPSSSNFAASQPASKRPPKTTLPSSLLQPSSCGCDKCPDYLDRRPLLVLPVLDEIIDHGGIGERRGVAEAARFVLRDLAQDTAHDLAGSGFGQARRELDQIGRGDRADVLAHPRHQFLAQRFGGLLAGHQRHVSVDALALDVVGIADHGGFRHRF